MIIHDSHNAFFRAPLGAQPADTHITIRMQSDEPIALAFVRLWWDNAEIKLDMNKETPDVYAVQLTLPSHPGLLWYHFVLEMKDGSTVFYGNAGDRMGGEGELSSHEPPSFQITVYDPRYDTPHWMRDGIMYHIMTDRFYASKPVAERPAPENGHWHMKWDEPPELDIHDATSDNISDDFFGGDLNGIREKLPYLKQLGVTILYLSPIFRARSNHKYNTGDYRQIDPSFGTHEDFRALCQAAKQLGMHVMLDGVFSHTGSDSRYFNKDGNYDELGAYQSPKSPYYDWYHFRHWPDQYESWWGFETLPVVDKLEPAYLDFIIRSDDAVTSHWLRQGASGWRLDVADELPMKFLYLLRERLKRESADHAILGEVWEDASSKVAYGELRCYCLGDTLDSVMNYPLREMMIDFMLGRANAQEFVRRLTHMQHNYPKPFFYSLMNLLSSHDKPRIIGVLAGVGDMEPPRDQRRVVKLKKTEYNLGKQRLLLAWQLICALPGMPSLYYADEAGLVGMADPFCRGTYPWGHEDQQLLDEVRRIASERHLHPVWARGELFVHEQGDDVVIVVRKIAHGVDAFGDPAPDAVGICAINRGKKAVHLTVEGAKLDVPAMGSISMVRLG
ncbi:glycoside hydrolase family 13 protein [Eubacteriales bacterium OttesenSCG-928-N13]|nr:glycoside hydrolase family 13 protein [Eubacteriales bacterium OttesenSCG-928-N13]